MMSLLLLLTRHMLWSALLILSPLAVDGVGPYLILANSRPKCVSVLAPRGATLLVRYDAPDMVIVPDEEPLETNKKKEEDTVSLGLDSKYEKMYKQKVEAMRRMGRKITDMSIVVMQKGETVQDSRERMQMDKKLKKWGSGRIREELNKKEGVIEYNTGSRDGPVEVCIQSQSASPKSPSRFSLFVEQQVTRQRREPKDPTLPDSQRKAKEHMSRMEGDLIGLDRKVEIILSNADYAKEQEVQFHDQSLAMNRASQWWPMLHVAVLFITGFTQANHMVRFFRQRHIF